MQTLALSPNSIQQVEISTEMFYAVRNGAIFQKYIRPGGHFIFHGTNWKWGSKFATVEAAVEALNDDQVKGHVRIFKGNLLYAELKNGSLIVLKTPIPQLL